MTSASPGRWGIWPPTDRSPAPAGTSLLEEGRPAAAPGAGASPSMASRMAATRGSPEPVAAATGATSKLALLNAKAPAGTTSKLTLLNTKAPKARTLAKDPKARSSAKAPKARAPVKAPKARASAKDTKARASAKATKTRAPAKEPKNRKDRASGKESKDQSLVEGMTKGDLVIKLIKDAPQGYVPLSQLRQQFKTTYGKDTKHCLRKKWVSSLRDVYIDDNPVKDSVRISCKSLESEALIKTIQSQGGKIELHLLRGAYKRITQDNPPYPDKGVRKWILSVEGIQIEKEVVRLVPTGKKRKKRQNIILQGKAAVHPTGRKGKEATIKTRPLPCQMLFTQGGAICRLVPLKTDVPQTKNKENKKKKGQRKAVQREAAAVYIVRGETKVATIQTDQTALIPKPKKKKCIMQFGLTAGGKSFWPKNIKVEAKGGCQHKRQKRAYSRAIVSGYLANKRKEAGGAKARRKACNLNRLRNKNNPPAVPSAHALQRYQERGSSSTPIYKDIGSHGKVIIVTYTYAKRAIYSKAKNSQQTILLQVDQMKCSAKHTGLPRSKLSPRDAYLLKLSSKAATKEEQRRRFIRKRSQGSYLRPANFKFMRTKRKANSNNRCKTVGQPKKKQSKGTRK